MYWRSSWLGAFVTYLFLGLLQVFSKEIDDSLVCRICNGYQICGKKHSQTPECVNGIPCTVEQYRLCGSMADTIINQKCDHPGIFPDPNCPRKYYTCDNYKNTLSFHKRTWTCPSRTTFDPVTKRCLSTDEKRVLQAVQNSNRLNPTADDSRFVCKNVGIFPDPHDCKIYHVCNKKLESQDFYCSEGTYFDGVSCKKAQQCRWQLEKNSRNQLKRGEEIYALVRKLMETNRTTETENSFQDTAGTNNTLSVDTDNPTPESVNQTLRSMWNLQEMIADKIRELQKMSELSLLGIQNLQDTITTIAEKITKKVTIMTDYMNEKICSKVKKIGAEDSLKVKQLLYNIVVEWFCHQHANVTNLGAHYTTPVPITSTQITQLQTTIQPYINTTKEYKPTAKPNFEASTSKSFTETTTYYKKETEGTTHGYSSNIQQEQTSYYNETEQTYPTHKTTTSSSPQYNENKAKNEEITFVIHETTTTISHDSTKTSASTVSVRSQDGNFTRTINNEIGDAQTVPLKETTSAEFHTEHSTVDDEAQEGKTSKYKTTKISTGGNYTDTTSHLDVYTNNEDESHVTQELKTTFPSKNKTTEINTTIPVHVTTSDMRHSSEIQDTYYGGAASITENDTNATWYPTENTQQIGVNTNDETHVEQTVSSGKGMTTVGSDTEHPAVNVLKQNGITVAEHTVTTVEPYNKNRTVDVNSTDKDEHTESDSYEEKISTTPEPELSTETTFHTDVYTREEDDGHETLEEQTLVYQKTTTEHSAVNEETNHVKTTAPLEEKLTTEFDNETGPHVDANIDNEVYELTQTEKPSNFEHKSTTTGFYSEQPSDVQDEFEPKTSHSTFEPSTIEFHSGTTLHIHSDEDNEEETTAPFTTTTTGFNNETLPHTDVHSNDEDEHTGIYETTATPKHKATEHPSHHRTVEEITHSPTKGTDSEPTTETNRNNGKVAFNPTQKSSTAGSHSESTTHIYDEYDIDDEFSAYDNQNNTADEYDTDDMNYTEVRYDYVTYDVKTTSPFNRKNTTTEFSTESMPHRKSKTDVETRGRETSTAYDESTSHMDIQTSQKNKDIFEEITAGISDDEHFPHGQDAITTSVHIPTDSHSRTTDSSSTSVNGKTTSLTTPESYRKVVPNSIKNESHSINPISPPKHTTNNRSYKTTTSKFAVSPKGAITKAVTTGTILSTSPTQTVTSAKPPAPFRCLAAGYFVDPDDCHSFYRCSAVFANRNSCGDCTKAGKWKLVGTHHTCKNGRWFSKVLHKCVKFKPLLC